MWYNGDIVDNTYQIVRELGKGGMGVIYLAYHIRLQKYVVIKRIKDGFENLIAVRNEADILKGLRHQFLPQVYDFVAIDQSVYTVIDYIDGCDLGKYLQSGYTFTEEQLIYWLRQLLEVLDYLHSQRPAILHCDIKPENIMLTTEGNVCLIDFNISLLLNGNSSLTGISPFYASPEQVALAMEISGRQPTTITLDAATDIYSLGASFYHLLSGCCPSSNAMNPLLQTMGLNYSAGLLKIVDRMMTYDKRHRYRSAADVTKALDAYYGGDKKRRGLFFRSAVAVGIYLIVCVCGASMCIQGQQMKIQDAFFVVASDFVTDVENGAYENAVDDGIAILNNTDFSDFMDKHQKNKAEILHGLGECYYYSDDFSTAVDYYAQAVQNYTDTDSVYYGYYCDYVTALIRNNNVSEAQNLMNAIKNQDGTTYSLMLLSAELDFRNGAYADVLKNVNIIIANAPSDIAQKGCELAARSCEATGDVAGQLSYLQKLQGMDYSLANCRHIADIYISLAQGLPKSDTTEKKIYYTRAKEYYETVNANANATYTDKMNLCVVYLSLGEDSAAISLLEELALLREDDYRVDMYFAFLYYEKKDDVKAAKYVRSAKQKYESTVESEREDRYSSNIQNLYELYQKYYQ